MYEPGYTRTEAIGAMKVLSELVEIFESQEEDRTYTRAQVLEALRVSRTTLQDAVAKDLITSASPPRAKRRRWF